MWVRFEEKSVDLLDSPIVAEVVDVALQERFRQRTVEQVAGSPVPQIVAETSEAMRMGTAEQIA